MGVLFPAGFLVVLVLAINLVGDGLRDALRSRTRRDAATADARRRRDRCSTVSDLSVTFRTEAGTRHGGARRSSYDVRAGEVLGIVGESGSGKSVSSLAIMDLLPAHARVTGSVRLARRRTARTLRPASCREIRGKQIAMVFQDPLSALTPVYTVGDQIAEAILVHDETSAKAAARTTRGRTARTGRHPESASSARPRSRTSSPAACASA